MKNKSIVESIPLFYQADPSSKDKIATYAITRKYKKGEYLFHVRDSVERIYVVVSGYAVLERVNSNNDKRAIFLLTHGDIVNEVILDERVSSINCYAISNLEVVSFTRSQFQDVMKDDFNFTMLVLKSMSNKIRRLYHQLENTTKMMKLDKQVASKLWKIGRDYGIEKENYLEIPFDITITFLAGLVGSNRETISRIVKKMSNVNIISIQNGICRIYDMQSLCDIAKS